MNPEIEAQINEWRSLYNDILMILERHGKNDACGEGDFWLLDDNWGGGPHRLYIFNISIVTRELVDEFMKLLSTEKHAGWEMMLILDLKSPTGEEIPPEGLFVRGNFVEEFWNKEKLKALFGEKFRWS